MNRRAFLQRFGIGLAGALALANLPKAAVAALDVAEAGRLLACEHLRRAWNDHMRGKGIDDLPHHLEVSRGLLSAYEGELRSNQRYVVFNDEEDDEAQFKGALLFKGAWIIAAPDIRDWTVRFAPRPAGWGYRA